MKSRKRLNKIFVFFLMKLFHTIAVFREMYVELSGVKIHRQFIKLKMLLQVFFFFFYSIHWVIPLHPKQTFLISSDVER